MTTLDELDAKPWRMELHQKPDGYEGRVVELKGCVVHGTNFNEVLESLKVARREWLERALADGRSIPDPQPDYSGTIFIRTSPDLHRRVAEAAAAQRVSMSQWVAEVLAREVGSQS